ncbi:hypothetical protein BN2537_14389 [Streptomyces venezuelae]|nr:hypothetical protein BN2537_14389 [Streptomyces venezuelae]
MQRVPSSRNSSSGTESSVNHRATTGLRVRAIEASRTTDHH